MANKIISEIQYPDATIYDIKDKNALNKSQITNCLLEVPQRIRLELNDGTLTLKAGSQVIIPNGFEADGTTPKFDEVVVGKDLITGPITKGTGELLAYYNYTSSSITARFVTKSYSSSTNPNVTYSAWYDTTNNKIYDIKADTSSTNSLLSLPIAKITIDSNDVITSIDQVFNGMGYIGSTVWVDKGVKGLIPNGRNEDGSLNNIEWTTQNLILRNNTEKGSWYLAILNNGTRVSIASNQNWNFDEKSNHILNNGVIRDNIGFYGNITLGTNGAISNFNPKQPFRAVDYSDIWYDSLTQTLHIGG